MIGDSDDSLHPSITADNFTLEYLAANFGVRRHDGLLSSDGCSVLVVGAVTVAAGVVCGYVYVDM